MKKKKTTMKLKLYADEKRLLICLIYIVIMKVIGLNRHNYPTNMCIQIYTIYMYIRKTAKILHLLPLIFFVIMLLIAMCVCSVYMWSVDCCYHSWIKLCHKTFWASFTWIQTWHRIINDRCCSLFTHKLHSFFISF